MSSNMEVDDFILHFLLFKEFFFPLRQSIAHKQRSIKLSLVCQGYTALLFPASNEFLFGPHTPISLTLFV